MKPKNTDYIGLMVVIIMMFGIFLVIYHITPPVEPTTPIVYTQNNSLNATVQVNGGTGVIIKITNTYIYILTAAHVVSDLTFDIVQGETPDLYTLGVLGKLKPVNMVRFYKRDKQGDVLSSEIAVAYKALGVLKQKDLAIIEVKRTGFEYVISTVVLDDLPSLGDSLYVIGCPKSVDPILVKGNYAGRQKWNKGIRGVFTGGVYYGNSGCGVFSVNHKLVGIISAINKGRYPIYFMGLFNFVTAEDIKEIMSGEGADITAPWRLFSIDV